ncbi:MAG: acyl-[acyl-carrier-protein]--UDP-N-acetylglucosamine O-acyltransferase [Omnitrophica WOR_2 bacterium RIFCSPLOWO2_12_FULL_51_24]|nr:MAG: acyl-[acyl-carrier-protein]--UDP-N-acetylglucosamine O-acyltransferase [Omnitrophica WOR_2 bacterium RIFCSPLOWO2_02_FULL_50_19]OGX41492.1 MAG: acyl-[acyl-carrier-protein]--UDP-N-acetylglucosamine O-acyltransferase [Omnitrophica WOR_2 bacterium RIFCSPLOWO2_12_FULL_51_24]
MKIHPTAIVDKKAELADGVEVGPYCLIGPDVKVGSGTVIGAHAVIDGHTTIGKNNRIFTGAVIGSITQDLKFKGERSYVKIGDNNIIREYVTINMGTDKESSTVIGNKVLLMAYCHVAHDCVIKDGAIIANCGTLAGYVTVEEKADIGGLTGVHQFVRIGKLAIIGGCSKVTQDVVPFSMSDGHPLKIYGLNAVGLERAKVPQESRNALKKAFKILFNSGLTVSHALDEIKSEVRKCPEVDYLVEFTAASERGISR